MSYYVASFSCTASVLNLLLSLLSILLCAVAACIKASDLIALCDALFKLHTILFTRTERPTLPVVITDFYSCSVTVQISR